MDKSKVDLWFLKTPEQILQNTEQAGAAQGKLLPFIPPLY